MWQFFQPPQTYFLAGRLYKHSRIERQSFHKALTESERQVNEYGQGILWVFGNCRKKGAWLGVGPSMPQDAVAFPGNSKEPIFSLRQTHGGCKKLDLYRGRNPREVPTCSFSEASRCLQIPLKTLRSWIRGRIYLTAASKKKFDLVIHLPDADLPLFSFTNKAFAP
ncbi:MAG TPA: hypothetical protein PLD20_09025 [Blastocatellia bacterium]|nr:hypothetical protein [Blastocatellia bacterium]HMV85447.1 hypothetical protein [Blastocatellia bacterium]HMX24657.1 hypothetical protein [Blastocatellia bacterium]HMY70568.1 hypothetical protein [Blastocatellia bacterium]HMZ18059.1 hypothetical protein [Blastocatellia bacterium]